MIYIPNTNHEAALNLAMEEYILTFSGIRDAVLFFYINAPSIIIGRHQNTAEEINRDFVREHGIQVVRRCSGGGAVYHDLGNLNYSLITPGAENTSGDFSALMLPILSALRGMGLDAELSGRNDLTLDGAKFSGNAYYHNRYGSVVHGTLLFDSDLEVLSKALKPDPEKLLSKGVKSVRSRVCCIKNALPEIPDTEALKAAIIRHFEAGNGLKTREFTPEDMEKAEALANRRYRNDSWNYGESPAYNIRRTFRLPCGWIDLRADIRDDRIRGIRFFGDYFCTGEISDLENALSGVLWERKAVREALEAAGSERYFPDLSPEELAGMVFSGKAGA